jgi:hypothetical protein
MKFLEIIISVCTAGCVLGLDVYKDDIRLLKEELESLKSETSKFLKFKSFFLLPIIYIKMIHICPPGELFFV